MKRSVLVFVLLAPVLNARAEHPPRLEWLKEFEDPEGRVFLTAASLSRERSLAILNQLRVDPVAGPGAPSTSTERTTQGWETVFESSLLSIKSLAEPPPGDLIPAGLDLERYAAPSSADFEVLGQSFSLTSTPKEGGEVVLTDSQGGARWQRYGRHGLVWAKDSVGPLVGVEYDSIGRARKIHLGLELILEYVYAESPERSIDALRWAEKRLTNQSGEPLGSWTWSNPPTARPSARLWIHRDNQKMLTGEWDDELYPAGRAVVTLGPDPYALLPLGESEEIWRSVSLPPQLSNNDLAQASSSDRLDYTDRIFRLWLALSGPPGTSYALALEWPRERHR